MSKVLNVLNCRRLYVYPIIISVFLAPFIYDAARKKHAINKFNASHQEQINGDCAQNIKMMLGVTSMGLILMTMIVLRQEGITGKHLPKITAGILGFLDGTLLGSLTILSLCIKQENMPFTNTANNYNYYCNTATNYNMIIGDHSLQNTIPDQHNTTVAGDPCTQAGGVISIFYNPRNRMVLFRDIKPNQHGTNIATVEPVNLKATSDGYFQAICKANGQIIGKFDHRGVGVAS